MVYITCKVLQTKNGNILTVSKNGVVEKTYGYNDANWPDKLTSFNGSGIGYNSLGNPSNYYDGKFLSWSRGRQLGLVGIDADTYIYVYDANGNRVSKTKNGQSIAQFYMVDGVILEQTVGSNTLSYYYDEAGRKLGFRLNGTTDYYYEYNLQGDVIGIFDSSGAKIVTYTYDPWGKLLETGGTAADTIGLMNPIRYRGYYYDTETGFYFLQTRYYDPEVGRFISPDGAISGAGEDVRGYNMFAYCFNNPVNMSDPSGNWPKWGTILKAAAIVATAVVMAAAVVATVSTFGAASIAATIVITSAISVTAKAAEVAILQGKKSTSEGKSSGEVATDIIDAVFDNATKVVVEKGVTKTAGYASGFYSQSSTFQDVMQLQKLEGYHLKTMADAATYEVANRFTDFTSCVSAKASKSSIAFSYFLTGIDVTNTVISIFVDDPVQRANSRGYILK